MFVLGEVFRPRNRDTSSPTALSKFEVPTAEEGRAIPVVFGTAKLSAPNVIWYGDYHSTRLTKGVKSGIFGSDRLTIGHRYAIGMDLALCHGPLDALVGIQTEDSKKIDVLPNQIVYDTAGTGEIFTVDNPPGTAFGSTGAGRTLYGGDADFQIEAGAEGGVYAECVFYKGTSNAPQDPYLSTILVDVDEVTPIVPAYRGIAHVVWKGPSCGKKVYNVDASGKLIGQNEPFESGYIGISPSVKPFAFVVQRCPNMLSPTPTYSDTWYKVSTKDDSFPTPNVIIQNDANAADVIYELITNDDWGMGLDSAFINFLSFKYVQELLYNEGLGFSTVWDSPRDISDIIDEILRYIDCVLFTDLETGLITLKVIRNDYDVGNIPVFDESNCDLISFARSAWDETTNDLKLKYIDRNNSYKEKTVTAQDLANSRIQGVLISAETSYIGISNSFTARRIAQRDLRVLSTPLARATLRMSRRAYLLRPGDVFKFTWRDFYQNIDSMVLRVAKIRFGDLDNPIIEVEAIEDIFTLGSSIYSTDNGATWQEPNSDPIGDPADIAFDTYEAPYFFTGEKLKPHILCQQTTSSQIAFNNYVSSNGISGDYFLTDSGSVFTPVGTTQSLLSNNLTDYDTVTTLEVEALAPGLMDSIHSVPAINVLTGSNLALVCTADKTIQEIIGFENITYNNGTGNYELTNLYRGLLDTTPKTHAEFSLIWFFSYGSNISTQDYKLGDTTYVKMQCIASKGVSDLTDPQTLQIAGRSLKPYPPGRFYLNGNYNTTSLSAGANIAVTWEHRNRVVQGERAIKQFATGYQPELGTSYYLRFYNQSNTLLRTVGPLSHSTTSYTYTNANQVTDNGGTEPTIVTVHLYCKREGLYSYTAQERTLIRSGSIAFPATYNPPSDSYTPNNGENAAGIRGSLISTTQPTDHQTLVYNATTDMWEPMDITGMGDIQSTIITKSGTTANSHTSTGTWEDITDSTVVFTTTSAASVYSTFTFLMTADSANNEHFAIRFALDGATFSEHWLTTKDLQPSTGQRYSLTLHTVFSNVSAATSHNIKAQWFDNNSGLDVTFYDRRLTAIIGKSAGSPSFVPTSLTSLQYWFKADGLGLSNGNAVTQLTDYSGHSQHFTQSNSAFRGVYNTNQINSLPAVSFTAASSHRYTLGNFLGTSAAEMFVVIKGNNDPATSTMNSGYMGFGSDGVSGIHYPYTDGVIYDAWGSTFRKTTVNPSQNLDAWHIYNAQSETNNWTSRINGVQIFNTASNTVGWKATLSIGWDGITEFFDGKIAEILVFQPVLTTMERSDILNYLNNKYAL
jgi:hypothetical protein